MRVATLILVCFTAPSVAQHVPRPAPRESPHAARAELLQLAIHTESLERDILFESDVSWRTREAHDAGEVDGNAQIQVERSLSPWCRTLVDADPWEEFRGGDVGRRQSFRSLFDGQSTLVSFRNRGSGPESIFYSGRQLLLNRVMEMTGFVATSFGCGEPIGLRLSELVRNPANGVSRNQADFVLSLDLPGLRGTAILRSIDEELVLVRLTETERGTGKRIRDWECEEFDGQAGRLRRLPRTVRFRVFSPGGETVSTGWSRLAYEAPLDTTRAPGPWSDGPPAGSRLLDESTGRAFRVTYLEECRGVWHIPRIPEDLAFLSGRSTVPLPADDWSSTRTRSSVLARAFPTLRAWNPAVHAFALALKSYEFDADPDRLAAALGSDALWTGSASLADVARGLQQFGITATAHRFEAAEPEFWKDGGLWILHTGSGFALARSQGNSVARAVEDGHHLELQGDSAEWRAWRSSGSGLALRLDGPADPGPGWRPEDIAVLPPMTNHGVCGDIAAALRSTVVIYMPPDCRLQDQEIPPDVDIAGTRRSLCKRNARTAVRLEVDLIWSASEARTTSGQHLRKLGFVIGRDGSTVGLAHTLRMVVP